MTISEVFFHFAPDFQWPLECHPDTAEDLLKHKEIDESKNKSPILPGNRIYIDEDGKRHDYFFCDKVEKHSDNELNCDREYDNHFNETSYLLKYKA